MVSAPTGQNAGYYVPHQTHWPILGAIGMFLFMAGFGTLLNGLEVGGILMALGFAVIVSMMSGWFGQVIGENLSGRFNSQVDRTFRWGMAFFIFSEVMFFAAFFGALFYARAVSVPRLGGAVSPTHLFLYPHFPLAWPTNGPANVGGAFRGMSAWGIAAINTAILLTSSWTVTVAHHAIKDGKRGRMAIWLGLTILLGMSFLGLQAHEYHDAYTHLNMTLHSGIYGSTFFMLTGFHGLHVTIGTIMLITMFFRNLRGHFTEDNHFAFEAVSWYWHFVDVVWLCLFIFVYIM